MSRKSTEENHAGGGSDEGQQPDPHLLTPHERAVAVTMLKERLRLLGRRATEDTYTRDNFNSLAKWFHRAIKTPTDLALSGGAEEREGEGAGNTSTKAHFPRVRGDFVDDDILDENNFDAMSTDDEDDSSNDEEDGTRENAVVEGDAPADHAEDEELSVGEHVSQSAEYDVEKNISEAIADWKSNAKLSVAVTGSPGVGKSLLINTLLEATTQEEYTTDPFTEYADGDGGSGGGGGGGGSGRSLSGGYTFAASDDPMDCDHWGADSSTNPSSAIRPYNRYTSYSFESDSDFVAPCAKGFSVDDVVKETSPPSSSSSSSSLASSAGNTNGSHHVAMDPTIGAMLGVRSSPNQGSSSISKASESTIGVDAEVSVSTKDMARASTYKRATVYMFNNGSSSSASLYRSDHEAAGGKQQRRRRPTRKPQHVGHDLGHISKEFHPDGEFFSKIDWNKEKEKASVNNYTRWQMTQSQSIQLDDSRAFILPQGESSFFGPATVMVRYGSVPELVVSFPKEGELRLALWELHEIASGTKKAHTEDQVRVLKIRYRRMLGLSEDIDVPLPNIASPHDMPLSQEVQNLLGKNFRFLGLGRSLEQDRIYIREKLREITRHYGYHMCRVLVRLPSSLLEGDRELVEVSGVFTSELHTKLVLQNSHLLMVAVDKMRGMTADVAALLNTSGLAQKLLMRPESAKALFVELGERHEVALPGHLHGAAHSSDSDHQLAQFRQLVLNQFRVLLQYSAVQASQQLPPNLLQLVADTPVVSAKPVLFSSVHLQDNFPEDIMAHVSSSSSHPMSLRQVLASTNLPALISSIPNRVLARIAHTVNEMHHIMLQQLEDSTTATIASPQPPSQSPINGEDSMDVEGNADEEKKRDQQSQSPRVVVVPQRANPSGSAIFRTKTMDQSLSSFALLITRWKAELTARLQSVEQSSRAHAAQCTRALSAQLILVQQAGAGHQSDGAEILRHIKQHAVRPMLETAVSSWVKATEDLPQKTEETLYLCNAILQECANIVELHFTSLNFATEDVKQRLNKLQEFVRATGESSLKHLTSFRDALHGDPTPIVKEATIRVLQQHVIANVHGEFQHAKDVLDFPARASENILQRFSHLVQSAFRSLDSLQGELVQTIRAVIFAVKSRPGHQEAPSASPSPSPSPPPVTSSAPATVASIADTQRLFDKELWQQFLSNSDKEEQETRHRDAVAKSGLRPVAVVPDASAQFRSLAHQLYGSEHPYSVVRVLVVNEILSNPGAYESMIKQRDVGVDLQEYVHIMSMEECRGDHVTLHAFANMTGANLEVYSPSCSQPLLIKSSPTSTPATKTHNKVYTVSILPHDDYHSLVPMTVSPSASSSSLNIGRAGRSGRSRSGSTNSMFSSATDDDMSEDDTSSVDSSCSSSTAYRQHRRKKRKGVDSNGNSISRPGTRSPSPSPSPSPIGSKKAKRASSSLGLLPAMSKCPSLLQLCLRKLVFNIEHCPVLEGQLPEDILQRLIASLAEYKRLSDMALSKVVDSSMRSIVLDGSSCSSALTDVSLHLIANKCADLRKLSIANCVNITNSGVMQVASMCPELEWISLQGCVGVGDLCIQEIARKCPKLIHIDLSGCPQVTDVSIQELMLACPQLQSVVLQHCNQSTDASFAYVNKNMHVLDLADCELITNKTLLSIAKRCPQLRVLRISGRHFTDIGLEEIGRHCQQLRIFEIANADNVTDVGAQAILRNCRSLNTVSFASCRSIGNGAFAVTTNDGEGDDEQEQQVAMDVVMEGGSRGTRAVQQQHQQHLPLELESINLSMCLNVGSAAILSIAQQCRLLRHVNLSNCQEIEDAAIVSLAESCRSIRSLDLTKCAKLSDISIKAIAHHCRRLQKLTLFNCQEVTTESIVEVAKHCKKIQEVDMSACDRITDRALEALANGCPRLRSVSVSDCTKLTTVGIIALATCSRLTKLRLAGCKGLTDDSLAKLTIGCPDISELDLAYCTTVSVAALQKALTVWTKLLKLNLRGFGSNAQNDAGPVGAVLDNNGGPPFVLQHNNLEELNLSWCKHVDDNTISQIAEGCPNLVHLDLAWCARITANAFHRLAQRCAALRTLNLRGCTRVGLLNLQYLSGASIVVYR